MAGNRLSQKGIKDTTGTNQVTVFAPTTGMNANVSIVTAYLEIATLNAAGAPRNLTLSIMIDAVEVDTFTIPLTVTNGEVRTEIVTPMFIPLQPLPLGQGNALHARVDEALDVDSEIRFVTAAIEGVDV